MAFINDAGRKRLWVGLFGCIATCSVHAALAATPPSFTVGSANVATADPTVPRPPGKACTVELFSGFTFRDFSNHPFTYAPPAGCGTSWSKVVLEADFAVTAGHQFDRTASLWLGGANIYFGTTQEPSPTVSPSWHIERDVSDFASLLSQPQSGQAILENVVDDTYTGIISGSARLVFYPANILAPKVDAPDAVFPLSDSAVGGTGVLSRTLTLPTNVERAYLDVYAQGQGQGEFWFSCDQGQGCAAGPYREVQVSIDGQQVGVAPVYPWIFTGGIDPYMWQPTPGVQALNFLPYRVDLTPFAAVLNDGRPHALAIVVTGANRDFAVIGNLFVHLDHARKVVTGAVVANTLQGQPAVASVDKHVTNADGVTGNSTTTHASRSFRVAGYVDTSQGRIITDVNQTVTFRNTQTDSVHDQKGPLHFQKDVDQLSTVDSTTTTRQGPLGIAVTTETHFDYPLVASLGTTFEGAGKMVKPSAVTQGFSRQFSKKLGRLLIYRSDIDNIIDTADTLNLTEGRITGNTAQRSIQEFRFKDNLGNCYSRDIATAAGVLTAATDGGACPQGRNRSSWFTHPDGSPDTSRTEYPRIF
ncbi:peptide-N4-asparagine amidase [Xanthomonas theicola]|nr:peptide-N4-asparagine amidase [Xanthomonas theicola]QNH26002.1 peptide-N(4)-(N-acetyl-beta-glucosaminyl)asparagine amidase [Xanthomonas theicola]